MFWIRQPWPMRTLPMKQPWPIEQRSPMYAPGITCTKCQMRVSAPTCVFGPSTIAVGWMCCGIGVLYKIVQIEV